MGVVTNIINSMLRYNIESYDTKTIKIEIDVEGCITYLKIDKSIDLDEEDSFTLGPLYWREILRHHGRNVDITDNYALSLTDELFVYDIVKRRNINIFMAYHFTNTFMHENINPILDIALCSRPPAFVTIKKKGKDIEKLDKKGLIEVVKALAFLHDHNVVFQGTYPHCLKLIDNKVMLDDFTNSMRSKEDFNKDICMLAYFISESFPQLSKDMLKGQYNMKDVLKVLQDESKEEKKYVINNCRYYPKNFADKCSNLTQYIKKYHSQRYRNKIDVEDVLHLLNRVVHSFSSYHLENVCKAISHLLAFYHGYAFVYEEIDFNVFNTILSIIRMTRGCIFYAYNPT